MIIKQLEIVFKNFPSGNTNIEGVYKINNEYIGASIEIRTRILDHHRKASEKYFNLLVNSNRKLSREELLSNKIFSNGERAILKSFINKEDIIVEFLDGVAENEHKHKKRSRGETFYHENPSHKNKCKCGVCSLMRRIQSLPYVY